MHNLGNRKIGIYLIIKNCILNIIFNFLIIRGYFKDIRRKSVLVIETDNR